MIGPDPYQIANLLRRSLEEGYQPIATVTSDSMAPLLRTGDEIQVAPVARTQLKAGDVLLMALPDELLAHRFWAAAKQIDDTFLITKGDRLSYFDPPCPDESLIGKVVARKRHGDVLPFVNGRGRWLNEWVFWLSGLELRFLGLNTHDIFMDDINVQLSGNTPAIQEPKGVRIVRQLLYWAALVPTRVVEASIRQ